MVMTGYQRPTLRLEWPEDSEFHGLVVRMTRMSVGEYLDSPVLNSTVLRMLASDDRASINDLAGLIRTHTLEWNLLDQAGVPVELTMNSLIGQDPLLLDAIARAWLNASTGVSAPLSPPSADGEPFPEESLPMEIALPNPGNSPGPE
jgi:hypothetical protein